ncbi:lysM domain containing protein [Musa troglodytarum]|uniref:LysM domain containing protein n=1 Tax=Musa troglodytarum TaxID=320322 RepID=A0A9E7F9Q8_9LILI|nr:lysM domain containing protein [Musa troglodytarum]
MMLAEGSRRNSQLFSDDSLDGDVARPREIDGIATIPVSSSLSPSSSPGFSLESNHIQHRVSRMDTLAGVAIKYGVEVADIKRLNGLVTDLQMFAHKSLQIPLPGRHPPSPCLSDGSVENGDQSQPHRPRNDVLELIESINMRPHPRKVSPAMSRLQGYYGLGHTKRGPVLGGEDMPLYGTRKCCFDDELLYKKSPTSDPPPSRHRKSRSLMNGFSLENGDLAVFEAGENSDIERSIRRRQKTDAPELFLQDSNGGFSGRTGKGIAPRPKSGYRIDTDVGRSSALPNGDYVKNEGLASVRKSSSASCLQSQDFDNVSSMWPMSKWSLKSDVLARPIFDGLPKSMTVRRNKAARD